jgi:hypothetical protein
MGNDLTTPSTAPRSVSHEVIDRLFQKFAAMYGKHWLDLWAHIPMDAVKAEWMAQLERMPLPALRLAIQHVEVHNKFPPTLPEFRGLCEQFKPRETPRLSLTDKRRGEMPQEFKAVLAKLRAK